jgi:hypothetical protein
MRRLLVSNAARKARKRAGVKFERKVKVGTPYLMRDISIDPMVQAQNYNLHRVNRSFSARKVERWARMAEVVLGKKEKA